MSSHLRDKHPIGLTRGVRGRQNWGKDPMHTPNNEGHVNDDTYKYSVENSDRSIER
jgi:hypothetical protein